MRGHVVTHVVAQPGVQEGNALLAIEYSEISSEVLRVDRALAAEMRRDNARKDSGQYGELELSPVSKIHDSIQQLRREPIVSSSRIAQFVSHFTNKTSEAARWPYYFAKFGRP